MIEDDVLKKAIEELLMTPAETESDTTTQKASEDVLMSERTTVSTNEESAEKAVQGVLSGAETDKVMVEMGVNTDISIPTSAAVGYNIKGMHITCFISNYNHNNFMRPANHRKDKARIEFFEYRSKST